MEQYLIYQDEKSQKFWSVKTEENTLTVTYGRLGSAGQKSVKTFDSAELCEKEAKKQTASKIKSGYKVSSAEDVQNTKEASKRFGYSYDQWDEGKTQKDLFNSIVNYKNFEHLTHITIANWQEPYECSCQEIIDLIVDNAPKFSNVESFTFGDMDYEECELSWINQGDYSKFWLIPNLKHISIQGSTDLVLGDIVSNSLQGIEIKCGGLPIDIMKSVEKAQAPNLEKFNLYLGVDNYGCDCTIEDVKDLLQNSNFPKLKYLGLCNSEMEMIREITKAVLTSKYAEQIEILDLSKSVFTDECAELILADAERLKSLKLLDLEYHFLSSEMMKKLSSLTFEVNLKNQQEPDSDGSEYDYPMFTE